MSTLNENIQQAINDFDDIKEAIIEKGVDVPAGTPTSKYGDKIREIETGITPTGTIEITENGSYDVTQYAEADVDVPTRESDLIGVIQGDITSIDIPNGVSDIGYYRFSYNPYLKTVNLNTDLASISEGAFRSTGITSIELPNSLTYIGQFAFSDCPLTSITIPSKVGSLDDNAFKNCFGLKNVIIESTRLINIGNHAFDGCIMLTDIYYVGTESRWELITIGTDAIPEGATIHYEYTPEQL